MENKSPRFSINWIDLWKSVRAMLVVGAASSALYFIAQIEPGLVSKIPATYSFLVLPIVTLVTEMVRRWATDHTA